ncbi:hypothetical protein OH77DRAFT_1422232 [Trametes cingulata]|nr:hypothetical protein OH77DRAFT_1422232 [Trametes cingulata]
MTSIKHSTRQLDTEPDDMDSPTDSEGRAAELESVTPDSTTTLPSIDPPPGPDLQPATVMRFPAVPVDAHAGKHYYFLGWPCNQYVLSRTVAYVAKFTRANNIAHRSDLGGHMDIAFLWHKILKRDNFWFHSASPADASVEDPTGNEAVQLLIIAVTDPVVQAHTRPLTEAQYAMLVELYGGEARWYRDLFEKTDAVHMRSRFQ